MVPAEGCLGLNFKAKMNRVGRASPRTSRQVGGGSRDPSWKASHGTQEPRRNVRADLNVDREKSVSVQDIYGGWVQKMEQARRGGRPTRVVPEKRTQPSQALAQPCWLVGEEGPQFSSISTKHRLCHLAFTGRKAEATLLVSEKLSYGSRL